MNDENINQGAKKFKGLVKWFNDAKGFGFIQHEDGQDVFVHYSVIEQDGFRTLKDGEEVEYEMKPSDKGLQACKVSRINKTEIEIIKTVSSEEGSNITQALDYESGDEKQNSN